MRTNAASISPLAWAQVEGGRARAPTKGAGEPVRSHYSPEVPTWKTPVVPWVHERRDQRRLTPKRSAETTVSASEPKLTNARESVRGKSRQSGFGAHAKALTMAQSSAASSRTLRSTLEIPWLVVCWILHAFPTAVNSPPNTPTRTRGVSDSSRILNNSRVAASTRPRFFSGIGNSLVALMPLVLDEFGRQFFSDFFGNLDSGLK